MERYVTAYNGRNVAAIKELYPSFDGNVMEGFDKYELEGVKIQLSPDWASASVSATEIYRYKERSAPAIIECLFTLRREGNSWTIVSMRRGISRNIRG
jgi:hypothetical protein